MSAARLDPILARAPVLPVLAFDRLEDAVPLARTLVAHGLPVLEITLRSAIALEAIRRVISEVEGAVVGAGTVLTRADYAAVTAAGAAFAISPGATPALYDAAADSDVPFLPGVATASELMAGLERGLTRFKLFPAASVGGIALLRSFAGPFPGVRFCPTGGIDAASAPAYLALDNVLTVGGSWMAPPARVAAGDWDGIAALARACAALRPSPG
ncbi:bifunctional 4-hydroxy-2-oxoglutarate aldolase/2-dehydro-3-deoxy-phosphogluconate aldolase [Arenimonas sp. MALMAid1274]|uniref:bifunctional 4-hydroxy-2-oxoglutarate aldolase/2-dehydro-3-deoxy-phosphogluconate aldolase n=1 Tax=Arenimonas sp. MALMAid1274 TaxID=3411630 RepID=UPI003B9E821B